MNTAENLECKKCNKTFAPRSNRAKFCDDCCTHRCEHCQSTFYRLIRYNYKPRFCSSACADLWQKTTEGRRAQSQQKLEERGTGRIVQCETCGTTFYRQGARLNTRHVFCSMACRDHRKEQSGIERFLHFPSKKGLNGLEKAGSAILDQMGCNHMQQQIIGAKFVVDVLIPEAKIVVQWDGDFWHGNPAQYPLLHPIQQANKKRDKACNAYLLKCGYRVLRFWEIDIHSRPSWVKSQIELALANSDNT